MKTTVKISVVLALLVAISTGAMVTNRKAGSSEKQVAIDMPANVKAIIDNKCYMCHNPNGRSPEAKKDLLWDSLSLYPKAKLIGKLDDISEIVQKGEMPPKKFVEMKPDAAISAADAKILTDWADETADKLMK